MPRTVESIEQLRSKLVGDGGLRPRLEGIAARAGLMLAPMDDTQVASGQISAELAERLPVRYPMIYLYCERIQNLQREKFRSFSGTVKLAAEIRASHDRLEDLDAQLQCYVDALVSVLHEHRGEWSAGVFHSGAYEVTYSAVKSGGKQFLKAAKVSLELDVVES